MGPSMGGATNSKKCGQKQITGFSSDFKLLYMTGISGMKLNKLS